MGAGHKLGPDQGGFRLEDIGVDQVQLIPTGIGIAVAGGGFQIIVGHLVLGKGVQHLFGVHQGSGFMALGMSGYSVQGFPFDFIPLYHWIGFPP